ncbi:MAG: laminin G domain-containing protein, partial [Verrucomicrobia bacterium]|nr:laminin G domain-containing protein [Verrucomicrobiota bacterium]
MTPSISRVQFITAFLSVFSLYVSAEPVEIGAADISQPQANFLLRATYAEGSGSIAYSVAGTNIAFDDGGSGELRVACRQEVGARGVIAAWLNGKPLLVETEFGEAWSPEGAPSPGERFVASREQSKDVLGMDGDFTVYARFRSEAGGRGTLISKCAAEGKWAPDAKALFLRDGHLVYDIGWLGAMVSESKVDDGDWHSVVLTVAKGIASLHLDGNEVARKIDFTRPDPEEFVFKIGAANRDFGLDFDGEIENIRFWERALDKVEIGQLSTGRAAETNTPLLNWTADPQSATDPPPTVVDGFVAHAIELIGGAERIQMMTIEPLADVSHRALIAGWDHSTLDRGATIYNSLCITCH